MARTTLKTVSGDSVTINTDRGLRVNAKINPAPSSEVLVSIDYPDDEGQVMSITVEMSLFELATFLSKIPRD